MNGSCFWSSMACHELVCILQQIGFTFWELARCDLNHMTACIQCKHPLLPPLWQLLHFLYVCLCVSKLQAELLLLVVGAAAGSQKGPSPDGRTRPPAAEWAASETVWCTGQCHWALDPDQDGGRALQSLKHCFPLWSSLILLFIISVDRCRSHSFFKLQKEKHHRKYQESQDWYLLLRRL